MNDPVHGGVPVPKLEWTSERTLRIGIAVAISDAASTRVRMLAARIRELSLPAVVDVTPAYTTVLVTCDPLLVERAVVERAVLGALPGGGGDEVERSRSFEIPVCYASELGPDLADVAGIHGCSGEEVVRRHAEPVYRVSFLGFSPGFAYLSGLAWSLHTPRLTRPRMMVPAGSVAIGGEQTGIYPHSTPGGWRIIGRTPLVMFDARRDQPALLAAGDEVRFVPVDRAEFDRLALEARR